MTAILWNRHLEIGHPVLDEQHRTLVDTYNRLCAKAREGAGKREELEGLLVFLRTFALRHFETEQELMARHGYPFEAEHRRLHTDLAGRIETLLESFHSGETELTAVTLEYLDAWLQEHIREEDFRLAEFLKTAEAR